MSLSFHDASVGESLNNSHQGFRYRVNLAMPEVVNILNVDRSYYNGPPYVKAAATTLVQSCIPFLIVDGTPNTLKNWYALANEAPH